MNHEQVEFASKNILVVDDTPANLRFLAAMLGKQGYKVRKALSGEMALTACQVVLPDLILLDIMMPEMDGYKVCQKLKEDVRTCKIPVIFLSALDDVFDKVKAFEVGGIDYITKPFQYEEVLVRVQNQLRLRAAEAQIQQLNTELEARVKERTHQLEIANQELKREIVERQQLQNQLLHLALHDSLTDLPNRAFFLERLQQLTERAKQQQDCQFAVLFLDCDRFKVVNDSLGHGVGDELLIAIARRLEATLTKINTLARMGGDEFAILLENVAEIDTATEVAERILQALAAPFLLLSRFEVFINASIGIVLGNQSSEQPEHLLRDADTAMYRAKALGKARYHVFNPAMHVEATERLELENDLRRAIERQQFIVYYQPIVCLKTGKLEGFEALVRWQHPTRGIVSPAEFIPIAEETGLIAAIDLWVLREACHQLKTWQQSSNLGERLTLSANLSGKVFYQTPLVQQIDQILQEVSLPPFSLKLEITESTIIENSEVAIVVLQQLKERQIILCLDDFGTGYSSLGYLHRFPIDILKIDQSFIKRMTGSQARDELVPAIISIARTMGLSAIAEGVETYEQLDRLQSLNCDFAQGYLFSKPLESKLASNLIVAAPPWKISSAV